MDAAFVHRSRVTATPLPALPRRLARVSTRPGPEAALQARARRQAGAFTRSQALSFGFSARQIDGRLASAAWSRVLTSIYVANAAPITWLTWAWAGVLSAGPDGAVMGTSAAALRGWLPQTWPIVVALPTDTRRRWPVAKLRLARLELPTSDVTKVGGLPVTTRLRTAADLAHELPLTKAQELIDRLLVLEVIDLPSLTAAVEASTRRGSRQARRLVGKRRRLGCVRGRAPLSSDSAGRWPRMVRCQSRD